MTDKEIENIITNKGERCIETIPVQRCILSHDKGHVIFKDEFHQDDSLFSDDCSCYIQGLVDACLESFEAEYFKREIFTCSCGDAECAGFHKVYSLLKNGQIYICVNDEIIFHFYQEQFKTEVMKILENMLNELKTEYALYPFPGTITDDDEIMEMIKKLKPDYDFSDYLKSRPHKILIMGDGENIYRDIDKEWHSFEKDGSLIFWKEGKTTATVKLEGFLEWSLETKNINSLSAGGFSWQDWNNRGILFAQKLAEQLPENYYVYYGFNPHDNNNQGKKPFRILKL